ncbi:MAG TPA: OmpH family outer membrane protein [Gemmatimonadales bacterium]|nr:OmpH family outer membrane protein [Gemmatimonadales bacterium]
MKRVLVVCLALAATRTLSAQAAHAQTPAPRTVTGLKIAYVIPQQILDSTPGYVTAESTLAREVQGYRDEVQKMQQQMDSAVQALDQQSIALSPAAKQAKQKDLQNMQQRFDARTQELNQKAQQRQQELMAPIQQKIRTIIEAVRLEGGYSMVFNGDPSASGLLAADPALDITRTVVARIKQLPAQSN